MVSQDIELVMAKAIDILRAIKGDESDEYKKEAVKLEQVCNIVTGKCVFKGVINE